MENQSILNNCSIASAFYGIIQDEKNFGIKPAIGYAIVVEDKNLYRNKNNHKYCFKN